MTRCCVATLALLVVAGCDESAMVLSRPDAGRRSDSGVDLGAARDASADAPAVPPACAPGDAGFPTFDRVVLDPDYRSEGVGVLDVDNDGRLDIATDQYWYAGPDFATTHAIRAPVAALDPHGPVFANCFGVYPAELSGDTFTDIIVAPHATDTMVWYENPGDPSLLWTPHVIAPSPTAGLEAPIYEDLFGTGHPVLVMSDSTAQVFGWWEPGALPGDPWVRHDVGPPGLADAAGFRHGIGVGDVDGDGRLDVLTSKYWFAQPSVLTMPWTEHDFGAAFPENACSRLWTYDFDGDAMHRADVVCGAPHDYGLAWWRQGAPVAGEPTFAPSSIDGTVSQLHSVRLADLDGDGFPEIVTGKRWLANFDGSDPGSDDPALLVAYSFTRDLPGGTVTFTRHIVDGDSGVGGAFVVMDVDGRCGPDIVTSNKKGLFFFRHR